MIIMVEIYPEVAQHIMSVLKGFGMKCNKCLC